MKKDDILKDVYDFLAFSNPYDTQCVCGLDLNGPGCGTCALPRNHYESKKVNIMSKIQSVL